MIENYGRGQNSGHTRPRMALLWPRGQKAATGPVPVQPLLLGEQDDTPKSRCCVLGSAVWLGPQLLPPLRTRIHCAIEAPSCLHGHVHAGDCPEDVGDPADLRIWGQPHGGGVSAPGDSAPWSVNFIARKQTCLCAFGRIA